MQKTTNLFELSIDEINYRCEGLTESQCEILSCLTRGMKDKEVRTLLSMSMATFHARLYSAADRVGVDRRNQLIAVYAIWKYAQQQQHNTEYMVVEQTTPSLIVTLLKIKGL